MYRAIVIFIFFLFNTIFLQTALAAQPTINNMIFFGDSLSDIGNNTWILLNNNQGTPVTNPNDQNHKYIWVNYLVDQKLKNPVYPSSNFNLNPLSDNISYAYASADTSNQYFNADWPQNDPPLPFFNPNCTRPGVIKDAAGSITSTCVPGLQKQVDIYLNQVRFKPSLNTVFFIWAGANDLLNYYTAYMSHSIYKKTFIERFSLPSENELGILEQQTVNNINAAKSKLMDAGVSSKMIYILNLPDLSRTPAVRANNSWKLKIFYGKKKLESSLSRMTIDFNQKLQFQHDEAQYIIPVLHYVPIWNWFDNIVSNPKKYNLSYISESCVAQNAMPACKGYIFYNEKHPTTYVNRIIADNILSSLMV